MKRTTEDAETPSPDDGGPRLGAEYRVVTVGLNPAVDRAIAVDGLTVGAHQVGRELSCTAGGKSVNVSLVLAALGVPSSATGFLGADNRAIFAQAFAGAGGPSVRIADEFQTLPGRTRENITLLDTCSGQETHIRLPGLAVDSPAQGRLAERLRGLTDLGGVGAPSAGKRPAAPCVAIFSGSLPPGAGPVALGRLIDLCRAAGAKVAVDAGGPSLATATARPLWLVKPNIQELAELAGRPLGSFAEQLAAARELAGRVEMVLLSRGDQGACMVTRAGAMSAMVTLPPGSVRNTVGCGDALLASFVAALMRGRDLRQALTAAVACASACACTAATARFDPAVMADLAQAVQTTDLP
jgi:1-phosphofructokinase